MSDIASSFRHTVGALKPALVNCLDFMNALPFFRTYKTHSWDALQITSDKKILDVACGVGFDVVEMAKKISMCPFFGCRHQRRISASSERQGLRASERRLFSGRRCVTAISKPLLRWR